MILVDFNQIMIANLMMQLGNHKNAEVDENMLRHMILNSLRSNRKKFAQEYGGDFIICADDKNYWRRAAFPYYKASRKKNRDESELDWNAIFTCLNKIREEIKVFFPYKVIQIDTAEADDIIGTIVHKEGTPLNSGEKILILSSDKDYIQLQTYGNVSQYDPARKKYITHSNPVQYLYEHIMKGDTGDGIPNILSADNCLVIGDRQKPVTQKRLAEWADPKNLNEQLLRNVKRNESLIDLSLVPDRIKDQILERYNAANTNDRSQLFSYFMTNKLRNLMENIQDF
jgi:5'-3' exonuclease